MLPEEMELTPDGLWEDHDDETTAVWDIPLLDTDLVRELKRRDKAGYFLLTNLWAGIIQQNLKQPPIDGRTRKIRDAWGKFLSVVQAPEGDKARPKWLKEARAEYEMMDEREKMKLSRPVAMKWHDAWIKGTSLSDRMEIAKGLEKDIAVLIRDGHIYTGFSNQRFLLAHAAEKHEKHTLRSLSGAINRNAGYLYNFCAFGSPRKLGFFDAIAIERLLDLPKYSLCDPEDAAIMRDKIARSVEEPVNASALMEIPLTDAVAEGASVAAYDIAADALKHMSQIVEEKDGRIDDLELAAGGLHDLLDNMEASRDELQAYIESPEFEEAKSKARVADAIMPLYAQVAAGQVSEIDARAAAGDGQLNETAETVVDKWRLPPMYLLDELGASHPGNLRIITVVGDSMSPTLEDGDKVMVDVEQTTPSPPGIFVVWDGLAVVCKRIEHIPGSDPIEVNIKSDNETYSTYSRTLEEAAIIGRVIWLSRKLS